MIEKTAYKMLALITSVGLLALAYAWHRNALIDSGYEKAMAEVREAESESLREQSREISRLLKVNNEAQLTWNTSTAALQRSIDRLSVHERWLRDQNAGLKRRLQESDSKAVIAYAEAVSGNYARLREDTVRFGREAAQCAATAHALKTANDAALAVPDKLKAE